MNTLSWRTPTTPLPMEINPRKVFERMFGQGGSAGRARRRARRRTAASSTRSRSRSAACSAASARKDRATVNDYLESVREIERRIQIAEQGAAGSDLDLPPAPGRHSLFASKSTSS